MFLFRANSVVYLCHFLKKDCKIFFLIFIASTTDQNPIQKANMMFLSKEAANKDQSLKMQMLSLDKDDSSNSEKNWKKTWLFLETKNAILQ